MPLPSLDSLIADLAELTGNGVTPDQRLADLPLDSLEVAEWLYHLELAYGILFDASFLSDDRLLEGSIEDIYHAAIRGHW